MAFRVCRGCGCRYAAGAPCCPECRGTAHDVIEEEAAMAKILPDGTVTYEPGHEPGSGEEHVHPAASAAAQDVPELEEESAESPSPAPVPAPVTVPAAADPAVKAAPKTPPRRSVPPKTGGDV